MIQKHAKLHLDTRSLLGEGPIWDPNSNHLYWVGITDCRLHAQDVQTGEHREFAFDEFVCAVSPCDDGRLLVALAKRLVFFEPLTGQLEDICAVEPELPDNRCNDGKRDPAGRFWIGTMARTGENKQGLGSLYRLDGSQLICVLNDLTISNGMGWSPDARTMYFIDSPRREVWAFDFDPADSSLSNQRTIIRTPESLGVPDGMTVGPDGSLWIAQWGGACVNQWDAQTGELLCRIETGCPHTTSCCLTPDGNLYITTAREGMSSEDLEAAPGSGGLFQLKNLISPRAAAIH